MGAVYYVSCTSHLPAHPKTLKRCLEHLVPRRIEREQKQAISLRPGGVARPSQ